MGYIQTRTTIYFANKFNIKKSLDNYKKLVLGGNKWKKWIYSKNMNNSNKIYCSGHYHFPRRNQKKLINLSFIKKILKNLEKFLEF